ncbi:flagellar basal body-associated FliL family protein [Pseudomonas sp. OIL-1]|uniref:flagellar basal body-associated FliL family protein n=1 Tax=Pseudomonas sp. OIL-1 TaxID=2706126 RepID=UPI003531B466
MKGLKKAWLALALAISAGLPAQAATDTPGTSPYVDLKPAFIGTIGPGPRLQYLKVDVALRASDNAAVSRIEYHNPLIRNILVTLFARQTPDALAGLEGKEQLRSEALQAVQQVLEEEEGQPLVRDLLFNNLITQ